MEAEARALNIGRAQVRALTTADRFPPAEEWPSFLNRLDSDPEKAREELYEWMFRWFAIRPPKLLGAAVKRGLVESVDELIHEMFVHLTVDDCRRLRQYQRLPGRPFGAWLSFVTFRWLSTALSKTGETPIDPEGDPMNSLETRKDFDANWQEAVRTVGECLQDLTPYQRVLIGYRAWDWEPREVQAVLRPRKSAKQIADDTRYAVKKLYESMEERKPGLFKSLFERDFEESHKGRGP